MINATQDRYIVKAEELETTTASGIYVKNTGGAQFAVIVNAGPNLVDPLATGTRVCLDWNSTIPLKHLDTTYYVVKHSAIHAVVED